ncbi:hypothetical protein B0H14DRAFT_2603623 [Mycena olivaceomarginata]|nr:hypothetical protein B0H14DRAFT_2603623 [Mycena olivaceomarginata]
MNRWAVLTRMRPVLEHHIAQKSQHPLQARCPHRTSSSESDDSAIYPVLKFFTWKYNASGVAKSGSSTVYKTLFQCCAIRPMYAPVLFATTPQAAGTGPAHARAALNPITEETGSPQNTFTSQTPAARVASHLLGRLDATTTSMASPGPRRGNRGHYSDDEESPDSEDLPPIPPPRRRRNIRPGLEGEPARGRSALLSSSEPMENLSEALNTVAISLNSDSDDDNSPIPARRTQPSRQQQQPAPRRNARTATGNVPGPTGPAMAATDKSAWDTDDTLKNSKSPDASYFFGKNIESGSYKCKICHLTTRCEHLEKRHLQEYLEVIGKYGWSNMLPKHRLSKLSKQRAEELGRVPFSNAELLKRLVKVIVSNDLVGDVPGS